MNTSKTKPGSTKGKSSTRKQHSLKKKRHDIAHLEKDKVFKPILKAVGTIQVKKSKDVYLALLKAIVSQQLSAKAAETIWQRFLNSFEDHYPDPKQLIARQPDSLRAVGLSHAKGGYLKNIAEFAIQGQLEHRHISKMEDEVLIAHLTQIKGVGKWTVEMLMMFSLGRMDILPLDDLGVQNGIKKHYGVKHKDKKSLHRGMLKVAEMWRPYRSLACMYIWRHNDLDKS